jgi:hypothetical protein
MQGLSMTVDVASAAEDPRVPLVAPMFDSIFGNGGKFKVNLVAADDRTIVSGVGTKERLADVVKQALAGDKGLAESSSIQEATKLLEPGAPWQFFVSPPGVVKWVTRFMEGVLAQFGGAMPAIPEYPDTPPVGGSINLTNGQLHADMVWTVETLESLAAFIKKCQALQ